MSPRPTHTVPAGFIAPCLPTSALHPPSGDGLEGIVSKHRDSGYRSGRSPHWIKSKNPLASTEAAYRAGEAMRLAAGGPQDDEPHADRGRQLISLDGLPQRSSEERLEDLARELMTVRATLPSDKPAYHAQNAKD